MKKTFSWRTLTSKKALMKNITLKGVRQNNLKNIDIEIPLGSFVVICGPSGSGKSSLAFQTLFAEGQRRFLESLSNYSRQFIAQAPKPLLDSAENIPPSIALEQKNAIKSSRSTVGTHTEIYDYIRTLYAKIGVPFCPQHNTPMKKFDASLATQNIFENLNEKRIYITTKLFFSSTKEFLEIRKKILEAGYIKALYLKDHEISLIDLEFVDPKDIESPFYLILDRLSVDKESELRVFDALSQAYHISRLLSGHSEATVISTEKDILTYKPYTSCSQCEEEFWELTPELFSFNNNAGACPACRGFGNSLSLDPNKIIPNNTLSIKQGAIVPFEMPSAKKERSRFLAFAKENNIDLNTPWRKLSKKDQSLLWEGDSYNSGINGFFDYLETKKYKMHVRVFLSRFKSSQKCISCEGGRLNPKLQQVKISDTHLNALMNKPLSELIVWFKNLSFDVETNKLIKDIKDQVTTRVQFLIDIGLPYLNLARETKTLSGGEFQRTNIAKQIGSSLSDTLYVLDEPTIGLHPRDNTRLIKLLKGLHENGNTLVLVEHDKEVIQSSELIFEMGPKSGILGGEVIFSGSLENLYKSKNSQTAPYLRGDKHSYQLREKTKANEFIRLEGCTGNNLKDLTLEIPLNKIVCITGVSGSGKSSLIAKTLFPAIVEKLTHEHQPDRLDYKKLILPQKISEVEFIDQQRVSKSKRSNIATYTKTFDHIRKLFASTKQAKVLGKNPGSFSLNTEGGRCPQCKGLGIEEIDMLFMDNIELTCELCQGKRFTKELLEIKYNNKNIDEVLRLTVSEALVFFSEQPSIVKSLNVLKQLGLDYLTLGQTLDTLSGGESQRLKLSKNLSGQKIQNKIFIFDEPSTGLHFNEIQLLLTVFNNLVLAGASVLIIEHNLDIIASSDWIVDLGPESGSQGGYIVAQGHPMDILDQNSYTCRYLKQHLNLES